MGLSIGLLRNVVTFLTICVDQLQNQHERQVNFLTMEPMEYKTTFQILFLTVFLYLLARMVVLLTLMGLPLLIGLKAKYG